MIVSSEFAIAVRFRAALDVTLLIYLHAILLVLIKVINEHNTLVKTSGLAFHICTNSFQLIACPSSLLMRHVLLELLILLLQSFTQLLLLLSLA